LLALLAFGITPGIAHAVITRLGVPEGPSAVVSIVLGIVAAVAIVTRGWHRTEDFEQYVKAEEVKAPEIGSEEREREVKENFEGFKQGVEDEYRAVVARQRKEARQREEAMQDLVETVKRKGAAGETVGWPVGREELLEEVKARLTVVC